ncbi:MAG: SBBP repeat-containing protein [Anaerolineae bacterium]|nr:SBBP repeat-containing protein [Anaerolineae bacterium]
MSTPSPRLLIFIGTTILLIALTFPGLSNANRTTLADTNPTLDTSSMAPNLQAGNRYAEEATIPEGSIATRNTDVMFIENVGQWANDAHFQLRGGNGTVWLTDNAVWLTLLESRSTEEEHGEPRPTPQFSNSPSAETTRAGNNIRVSFAGANQHPRLEPFDRLDTQVSYFVGNDPNDWHADVPAWAGVRYLGLYPGVDLELLERNNEGVWRLVAEDKGSLDQVRLQIEGAENLSVDDSGHLIMDVAFGRVYGPAVVLIKDRTSVQAQVEGNTVMFKPVEPSDKAPERRQNESLIGSVTVSLTCLAESQHPYANHFDYTWTITNPDIHASGSRVHFSRVETESCCDQVRVLDQNGNIIQSVTGDYPSGLWSDPVPGRVVKVRLTTDYSVTRWGFCADTITSVATAAYGTFLGGSGVDAGHAIIAGGGGIAYVAGETGSSNLPTTPGAFDRSSNGGRDIFVAKLQTTGNGLAFSTFIGGSGDDRAYALSVDAGGAIYLTGSSSSINFPTTPGALDTAYNGNTDVVVVKLNTTGTALLYSTYLGGTATDEAIGLAIDGVGAAYLAGYTVSSNFPTTPGAFDTTWNGGSPYSDAFVAKINPNGGALAYSTFLGDTNEDYANGVAVDGHGNAYVVGWTNSTNFPITVGAFNTTFAGDKDVFVTKLSGSGNNLVYSGLLGGTEDDQGQAVAIDVSGAAYVAGQTSSRNFTIASGAYDSNLGGLWDGFVAKISPAGHALVYSTYLGGSGSDCETSGIHRECVITADASGAAYVVGRTSSSDFPTTVNGFDLSYNGGEDSFMVKFKPDGSGLTFGSFFGGSSSDQALGVAVDTAGSAYFTGRTDSTNFPTTPGSFDTTYNGGSDAFVVKLAVGGTNPPTAPRVIAPIDRPPRNSTVTGSITIFGYAIDLNSGTGTGIDQVHIYLDGPYGTGHIIGAAQYGLSRPDVGNYYHDQRFTPSGWQLAWNTTGVTPGAHSLYLYAHRTTDNRWSLFGPHNITVAGPPTRTPTVTPTPTYAPNVIAPIETPQDGAAVSGSVTISGYAIDRNSRTGTGVNTVHLYLDGPYGTGTFLGQAEYGLSRPDIGTRYGNARFTPSGWRLVWNVGNLSYGTHRLYLYARRSTDGQWAMRGPHYVVIAAPPDPQPCQRYEPNNTLGTATGPLANGQTMEAALCTGDPDDFYYIELSAGATLTLDLNNLPAGTDYDLLLYASTGGTPIAESRNTGIVAERIVKVITAGRYYIRVYPYAGRSDQAYRLHIVWGAASAVETEPSDSDKPPVPLN